MKTIDPILKEIASFFNKNGKEIYLVGGAVRDMLMGKKIHDFDLTTNALPEETSAIMKRAGGKVLPTGIKHGTVTVFYKSCKTEITTFRTESGYSDGRRPDQIQYTANINDDLSRRDFTMNAIALKLPCCETVDPFNGARDIKERIIRCVGNADERFNEDGLRPLRAVRFASQLGFRIEKKTFDAIGGALAVCAKVSWERVREEIDRILISPVPSAGFRLMEDTGLLKLFIPELEICRGVEQKGFHQFDVLDHSLLACDYSAAKGYSHEVRLAALFHDAGKPQVRRADETGIWTFYRHEEVSAEICRSVLNRLRYSGSITDSVCRLIRQHMFMYTDDWSDAAVRRFIARAGEASLENIYCLRRADAYGFSGKEPDFLSLIKLIDRVNSILESGRAFTIKDLAVSGDDLLAAGIPAGKTMGLILKELLETVLDDPAQNTRDKLLDISRKIYMERR